MTQNPTLNGQDIGRAHHATRAVLERRLADVGLGFAGWVTVNALGDSGGSAEQGTLVGQVVGGLKLSEAQVRVVLVELVERGLIRPDGTDRVALTPPGSALRTEVIAAITEITGRLYRDIPADDLAVAHRVLATLTARADAELAGISAAG